MKQNTVQQAQQPTRSLYVDAMKGLGIVLVLFGHFDEYYRGSLPLCNGVYECIYLFQMALFCVASGIVAKFSIKKLLTQQLWLYLISQAIMLFTRSALGETFATTKDMLLAWVTPWRHMWYLYALMWWMLTVPLLKFLRTRGGLWGRVLGIAGAVAFGLAAGLVEWPWWLGGRTVSFFPFFAIGVLSGDWLNSWNKLAERNFAIPLSCAAVFAVFYGGILRTVLAAPEPVYEGARLFQENSYAVGGYTLADRAGFYLVGALTVVILLPFLSKSKLLASLGRRTLPVYILHMPIFAVLVDLGVFEQANQHRPGGLIFWILFITAAVVSLLSSIVVVGPMNAIANIWYHLLPKLLSEFGDKSKNNNLNLE